MKMPKTIEPAMFAPCGMNCMVCYKHCYHKKPCAGCLNSDQGKPEHCRRCRIKDCVQAKGVGYCFACTEYPCHQIKNLEKSYKKRYETSLMENSKVVKERGIEAFLRQQRERYLCPGCGGVISLHDAECSECQYMLREKNKNSDLKKIPGVGTNMEQHLQNIGIHCIADLKGKDPEELYRLDCVKKGYQDDRCVLYVFRCAVYFAEQEHHDPEKLKWWYWKDKEEPEGSGSQ
ncbi:MAG: DUF3795 domain-containing protein [Lachnospiraceae bacterium]|nr:DUF3795 domain-containing protein [Lachnospiraceae bacterium]